MSKQPEIEFQKHIADFLVRERGYGVLDQEEITDPNYAIAEDHLWAFLKDTQAVALKKLADDYGTDARDEIFRALRKELAHTPLWILIRQGLKVRGLEFRLCYPKPRSSESIATKLYEKNRLTLRPHFYFGDKNEEIDLVIFLNGLPIVTIELKHEKNQNVHDAVAQYAARDHTHRIFQLPFVYPETNAAISEHILNGLNEGEQIEDRFEGNDYRLMVVANKFQTGFDQPLLAGMFIDKPVVDRNAVQTLSRLNRAHEGKSDVVVVDFTNNAKAILKAFAKYRKGTPFEPCEPDPAQCPKLHEEILAVGVFTQDDAHGLLKLIAQRDDPTIQTIISELRSRFQTKIPDPEHRKAFVYLLARLVKSYHFLTCFFTYPKDVKEFAVFAEYVGPQLIKQGTVSELMKQIRQTEVTKAAVEFKGEFKGGGTIKGPSGKGSLSGGPPVIKVSVQDMIAEIRSRFAITDEEALYIREVTEEKAKDEEIRTTVVSHKDDTNYLNDIFKIQVNKQIQTAYYERERYDELIDPKYIEAGAIFDIMAYTVIQQNVEQTLRI